MRQALLLLFFCTTGLFAQTEQLKFMQYNLMYYRASGPCTPTQGPTARDTELKNIFQFVKPTVFTVNELASGSSIAGFVLNNVINVDGEQNYDKAFSTNHATSPSSIVNMLFFDSTKVALHSQEYLDKELDGSSRIVRVIDFYRLYYKDPKLSLGADTIFFTVVVGHLKASSGSSDKAERGEAAKAIMKHLTNNVSDENVILCGDFNLYSNSEVAFQQFTNYSVASEKLYDPINQIGAWSGNSSFAPYHTQSTHATSSGCHVGGGLDDRFDFFLISDDLRSGNSGMKYKLNSYHTLGNDGNHFNQSINSGTNTSAPSGIITSLYNLSDHLPIIMEVDVNQSDISLSEEAIDNIQYTNPVRQHCIISGLPSEKGASISVYNIVGSPILHQEWPPHTSEIRLDLTSQPAGIYLLNINFDNGEKLTRKIIKQ